MSSGLLREWVDPQPAEVNPAFQEAIGGHPLVAQILVRRGLHDLARARAFLDPNAYTPSPPESFAEMDKACTRIDHAIAAGEPICIWGDFDVDGQTATTLLVQALRGLNGQVSYHIPVRARESHGVNREHLEAIIDSGVRLVITCDTGITASDALAYAKSRGVDVILTDHHSLPEQLPPAYATINPKLLPEDHPLSGLPGVGVAYKLAEALYQRARREAELPGLLDLVAMGIVADLALQTGDTRYLLQRGLPVLREARRTGLQILYELSNLQPAYLSEEHIGFVLGPRLNALGRLDDANPAVEFLTTTDPGRARGLATHLEGLNARRRLLTGQVLRGAQEMIAKDGSLLEQAALVLAHPEWPAGVIGIVASELVERYNRPTVLLSAPPGQAARGSARSIESVNITEAIAAQQALLQGFGGHPMAAGLALAAENIPAFRHGLSRYIEKSLKGAAPRPTLSIDGFISLGDLSLDLVADLERLAPFGPGNPPLALVIPRVTILSSSTIGRDGSHLQIMIKDEQDRTRRVIWWGGADWPLPEGIFDLACVVRASNFRGQRDVQVEWIDARPVETPEVSLRSVLSVVDQRGLEHPLPVLRDLIQDTSAQVWAEGEAKDKLAAARIQAEDRSGLQPVETLVIWSTPPGRAELQAALEATRARSVVVFGVDPSERSSAAFLKRLAGLVKYTLEKLDGEVSLPRLAGATAQREVAVRLGLQWLEARGWVKINRSHEDVIRLSPGGSTDDKRASQLGAQIQTLLEEVDAYRAFFHMADKDFLF